VAIAPGAHIGRVRLTVSDLAREQEFFERVLGLHELGRDGASVRLGPEGGSPLVELTGDPDAPPRPPGTTGLFHLAILVPRRLELARALRRVAEGGWRLTGASDHLVSEALYLRSPEYNGIEIYRDRPRDEWQQANGELRMATLPLDLGSIAAELDGDDDGRRGVSPDTLIGHVHLEVSDIPQAESFYHGLLGLDVTVRSYPGALFLSAGGYHHHVGVNVWETAGGAPPPAGAAGLDWFELLLPSQQEVERIVERSAAQPESREGGVLVRDPSGNGVLLRSGGTIA
jgi:catechol 2,3-dioxygenase